MGLFYKFYKFYFIMDTFGLLSPRHLEKNQIFIYSLSKEY